MVPALGRWDEQLRCPRRQRNNRTVSLYPLRSLRSRQSPASAAFWLFSASLFHAAKRVCRLLVLRDSSPISGDMHPRGTSPFRCELFIVPDIKHIFCLHHLPLWGKQPPGRSSISRNLQQQQLGLYVRLDRVFPHARAALAGQSFGLLIHGTGSATKSCAWCPEDEWPGPGRDSPAPSNSYPAKVPRYLGFRTGTIFMCLVLHPGDEPPLLIPQLASQLRQPISSKSY